MPTTCRCRAGRQRHGAAGGWECWRLGVQAAGGEAHVGLRGSWPDRHTRLGGDGR